MLDGPAQQRARRAAVLGPLIPGAGGVRGRPPGAVPHGNVEAIGHLPDVTRQSAAPGHRPGGAGPGVRPSRTRPSPARTHSCDPPVPRDAPPRGAWSSNLNPSSRHNFQSHWPLPPTFHAERAPNRTKHPGKAHVRREMWTLTMINVTRTASARQERAAGGRARPVHNRARLGQEAGSMMTFSPVRRDAFANAVAASSSG